MADRIGTTGHEHLDKLVALWGARDLVESQLRGAPERDAARRAALQTAAGEINGAANDAARTQALQKAFTTIIQAKQQEEALKTLKDELLVIEGAIPLTPIADALQLFEARHEQLVARERSAQDDHIGIAKEKTRIEEKRDELKNKLALPAAAGPHAAKAKA